MLPPETGQCPFPLIDPKPTDHLGKILLRLGVFSIALARVARNPGNICHVSILRGLVDRPASIPAEWYTCISQATRNIHNTDHTPRTQYEPRRTESFREHLGHGSSSLISRPPPTGRSHQVQLVPQPLHRIAVVWWQYSLPPHIVEASRTPFIRYRTISLIPLALRLQRHYTITQAPRNRGAPRD